MARHVIFEIRVEASETKLSQAKWNAVATAEDRPKAIIICLSRTDFFRH
jgi:hypothetical protein